MLARLRETERLLLLAAFFLFFLSASEDELLEEEPVRMGPVASAVVAASVSAGLVASTLFFGATAAVVAPASAVGLPVRHVSTLEMVGLGRSPR